MSHVTEGGIMKIFLAILFLLGMSVAQLVPDRVEYVGSMPSVEVIAQRVDDNTPAFVGSMPEVTVTAVRYEYEDEAWSGLMPEVVVTAVRPGFSEIALSNKKEIDFDLRVIPSTPVR
jgi:hypothetical protein